MIESVCQNSTVSFVCFLLRSMCEMRQAPDRMTDGSHTLVAMETEQTDTACCQRCRDALDTR